MKVQVNSQICAGFGVCLGLCPEVFALHDDGYAIVQVTDVPPKLEDAVRQAVSQCPSGAISLSDDSQ